MSLIRIRLRHACGAIIFPLVASTTLHAEPVDVLYATNKQYIQKINVDGSGRRPLAMTPGVGIAVDPHAGVIFYGSKELIFRNSLSGKNEKQILDLSAWGEKRTQNLAVDNVAAKLYWAANDTGKIQRANYDGSEVEDVITGLSKPTGVAVDPQDSKVYWSDKTDLRRIARASLDGSSAELLYSSENSNEIISLVVDPDGGRMYWTELPSNEVKRAKLDGSDVQSLYTLGQSSYIVGLALSSQPTPGGFKASRLYVSDMGRFTIHVSDLDGSKRATLPNTPAISLVVVSPDDMGSEINPTLAGSLLPKPPPNLELLADYIDSPVNHRQINAHFLAKQSKDQIRALKNDVLSIYFDTLDQDKRRSVVQMVPHIFPPTDGIDFLMNELLDLEQASDAHLFSSAIRGFDIATDIQSQERLASYLASLCRTIRTDPNFTRPILRRDMISSAQRALGNCGAAGLRVLMSMDSSGGDTYVIIRLMGTKEAIDFLISEYQTSRQTVYALRELAAILFKIEDETQHKLVVDGIHALLQSADNGYLIKAARMAGITRDPQFLPRLAELAKDVSYVAEKGVNGVRVQYYPIGEAAQTAIETIKRAQDPSYAKERHLIERSIPSARSQIQRAEEGISQGIDLEKNRRNLRWATDLLNEHLAELEKLQAEKN